MYVCACVYVCVRMRGFEGPPALYHPRGRLNPGALEQEVTDPDECDHHVGLGVGERVPVFDGEHHLVDKTTLRNRQ